MVSVNNKQAPVERSVPIVAVLAASVAALGATGTVTFAAARPSTPTAHVAYRIGGTSTAYLHRVRTSGAEIVEEGTVYGALNGKAKAQFDVGATVSGSFAIYLTHGGSVAGHGSGSLRNAGVYQAFTGSLSITSGSGRYIHAHGHGSFSGKINRHTYAVTLTTTGTLYY